MEPVSVDLAMLGSAAHIARAASMRRQFGRQTQASGGAGGVKNHSSAVPHPLSSPRLVGGPRDLAAASTSRITVLASFSLRVGDADIRNLPRKAQALLAFLGMQPSRRISREAAADLLWTDRGPEQARHSLRQSLLVLRRTPAGALIRTGTDTMWIEASNLWVDSLAMETALAQGTPAALSFGASLYGGPLLADLPPVSPGFDEWVRPERARLAGVAGEILHRLSAAQFDSGDFIAAAATAANLIGLEPLDEAAHRLRMMCLVRCGRRAEALLQFEACAEILKAELDVSPDQETVALAEQIRTGASGPPARPRHGAALPKPKGAAGHRWASTQTAGSGPVAVGPTSAAYMNEGARTISTLRAHFARRRFVWVFAAICLAGLLTTGLVLVMAALAATGPRP